MCGLSIPKQCIDLLKLKLENSWTQNYEAKQRNLQTFRNIYRYQRGRSECPLNSAFIGTKWTVHNMKVFPWRGSTALSKFIQCSEFFKCNMRTSLSHHWRNNLGYIQLKINVSYFKQDMTYCTLHFSFSRFFCIFLWFCFECL